MKRLPARLCLLLLFFFCLSQTAFAQRPDSIPAYQPPPSPPVHPENKFTSLKATPAGGCSPTFTYGCSYSDGLNSFAVNGVPLSTNTGCSASGYSSFTTTTTNVSPGKSYSFSATLLSSDYREGVAIWADLNGNQLFETGEKVYETPVLQITGSVAGAFTIPAGTATGPMAVRVMATYNSQNLSLCGNYLYGEVEDYVLNVVSPTGCDQPAVLLTGPTIITQGQTATLITSQTGDVPYSLTIGNSSNGNVQVFSNQTTATLSVTAAPANTTVYSVLAVSNACGVVATGGSSATVTVQGCDTPSGLNESEKTTYSIRLNWRPVLTASYYTIVWREAGAATSTTYTYGSSSTYTYLNPLAYGKAYEWQIRTNCTNGVSTPFSAVRSFTMSCPEPFSLTEVASGSGEQLQWGYQNSSATPVTYTIQWRPVGGSWQTINSICCSSYTLNNLSIGTTYEWQIRTNCPDGSSTAYSAIRTFTASCGPPSYSYVDYKTATTIRLYWAISGSTTYALQWRPQSPANSPFTSVTGLTTSSYGITGLTNGTGYDWQVRSICSGGTQSEFTALQSFTTACGTPYINTPNVGPNTVGLSWQNYGTGVGYNLVWRAVGSPTSTTVTGLTTSTYSLTGLTTGTAYTYQIQTVCVDGNVSGLTAPNSFTTQCTMPGYTSLGTVYSNSAYVYWGPVADPATRYDIIYRAVGSPVSTTVASLSSTNNQIGYTIPGLLSNTVYEWQVRARCSDGSSSAFTAPRSFTTTRCSAAALYTPTVGPNIASVSWQNLGTGVGYNLIWQAVGAPTSTTVTSLTTSTYSLTGLTNGTVYTWQVQTICTDGSVSGFTSPNSFTTQCTTPPYAYLSTAYSNSAYVYWGTSGDPATRYDLVYRAAGSPTSTTIASLTSTSTQIGYTIPGLLINTVYEWQVRTRCSDGSSSAFTTLQSFTTTGCSAPSGLAESGITSLGASLYWNWLGAGVSYDVVYRATGSPTSTTITLTNNYVNLTNLISSTVYQWQVRGICTDGSVSVFSPVKSFTTTACLTPTGLTELHIASTGALVSWNTDAGLQYVLQWRQAGSTTWPFSQTVSSTYSGTRNEQIFGLIDGGTYEWQVSARCPDGSVSPATSRTFTTGCNAPTRLFNLTTTSTGASVYWSGVYDATYRVRWRLTGATTWVESSTFTGSRYAITGLTSGNVYEWQPGLVCWNNSVAYPPNSLTFTTTCSAPGAYIPNVNDTFTTLYWTSGDTGTFYDAQYQQAGASTWVSVTGISTSSLLLTGLTPSTTYTYQVRARCGDGQVSPFSYAFSFTTLPACGIITSIRDGYWWDNNTWSCNRIPTATDPVEIRHTVTMPNYYTGYANRLGYGAGGRLIYETQGKLRLGQ